LLSAALLSVAGAAAASTATPAHLLRANKHTAVIAADHLLAGLVLPAGTKESATEPIGDDHDLARPLGLDVFLFAAEVDRHEFWTTTASPLTVLASIQAHLPAGTKFSAEGIATDITDAFTLPTTHSAALGPRTLIVGATELADGGTGVRADAVVRYVAPRLPAQQVPAGASVLQITQARGNGKPKLLMTVTKPSRVRRIAAVIDSLPIAADLKNEAVACPVIGPNDRYDTFTFRDASGGRALAQASESSYTPNGPDPCYPTYLTIRGRLKADLLDGGILLTRADAILGLKLSPA
jgi:hypothetical protein